MIRGFSAHLNCLYPELDDAARCNAAASAGFRCVEMWAPPPMSSQGPMIERLEKHNLTLGSVNTPQGPLPDDFGLAGDPSCVEWWRENFLGTLAFARRANARAINVLTGGRRQSAGRPAQLRCLLSNLDWALGQLERDDPVLLLEALNGADRRSPILVNADNVMSVIVQLGSPDQLRMLFDTYHLFQEEDDLIRTLHIVAGSIGHVQLADYPGRAEPGSGEIPFGRFLTELAGTSYDGWIGLEYLPTKAGSPFAWLRDYPELDARLLPQVAS
jgi:hydroxypyruvate isomerase